MLPVMTHLTMAYICRMCVHMERADSEGKAVCGLGPLCGGPASGKTFPMYQGPLQDRLEAYCFSCGCEAQHVLEIEENRLGTCINCIENILDIRS